MMPIKAEQQQISHDDEWILVEEDQSSESSNEYVEKIFRLNNQNHQDATANSNSKSSYSNKVATGRPLHTSRLENSSGNNSSQDDDADDYVRINDPVKPTSQPLTLELDHYTLVNMKGQTQMTIKEEEEPDEDEEFENEEFASSALNNSVKWNLEDLLVKKDDQKKERRKKRKWRTSCQKEI